MLRSNLAAVMRNALEAGIELLVVTWVFQSIEMHGFVRSLAPEEATIETVQLRAEERVWRARWASANDRPAINSFYEERYDGAQTTLADHLIDTTKLDAEQTTRAVAMVLGI